MHRAAYSPLASVHRDSSEDEDSDRDKDVEMGQLHSKAKAKKVGSLFLSG